MEIIKGAYFILREKHVYKGQHLCCQEFTLLYEEPKPNNGNGGYDGPECFDKNDLIADIYAAGWLDDEKLIEDYPTFGKDDLNKSYFPKKMEEDISKLKNDEIVHFLDKYKYKYTEIAANINAEFEIGD